MKKPIYLAINGDVLVKELEEMAERASRGYGVDGYVDKFKNEVEAIRKGKEQEELDEIIQIKHNGFQIGYGNMCDIVEGKYGKFSARKVNKENLEAANSLLKSENKHFRAGYRNGIKQALEDCEVA